MVLWCARVRSGDWEDVEHMADRNVASSRSPVLVEIVTTCESDSISDLAFSKLDSMRGFSLKLSSDIPALLG
jgi:hypothetical protein